jgi:hypothetical protein
MAADFRDLRGVNMIITHHFASPDSPMLWLQEANLSCINSIINCRERDEMHEVLPTITDALFHTQGQLVIDLRDKVYGILSFTEGSELIPNPTYEVSTADVYVNLTRSLIVHTKRIDCIGYKNPFGKTRLDVLSWALDPSTPCFATLATP